MIKKGNNLEDIEAKIRFLTTNEGGRKSNIPNGYRADHLIKKNYLTTGRHMYYNNEWALLGIPLLGTIKFIDPDSYPYTLSIGQLLPIQEGPKIVGYAKITNIFNQRLRK